MSDNSELSVADFFAFGNAAAAHTAALQKQKEEQKSQGDNEPPQED